MVRYCCICKLEQGQAEDLSLHGIPKKEELKVQWVNALGRELAKSATICSRHFKESDFYYKSVGDSIRRFLLPGAVPSKLSSGASDSEHVVTENGNSSINAETEEYETTTTPVWTTQETVEDIIASDDDSQTCNDGSSSLKKKAPQPLTGTKRFCNPRSVGDLRREDFSSDTSWQLVQTHIQESKNKVEVLNQKVHRLTKRIDSLQELLAHLENNGLLSCEGSEALEKENSYSPALKEFACTLLFYSTSAYNYVRNNFIKALPHPQTIRKWFSSIDLSPGVSQPVLDNVKSMIEESAANGQQLQFGLQVDEMSIKRGIEWDGKMYHGTVDLGVKDDHTDESNQATYALVFMLVCLNGHFKTPIAYYLIRSLSGEARANITGQILTMLHDNGISNIRSITFDGAPTNFAMVQRLGANTEDIDECFFKNNITHQDIVVIPDTCHMLKLVRNVTAKCVLIDKEGNAIQWNYLKMLVDIQETEGLHLGTKIRRRHINFEKEKMKVKLAAQAFGTWKTFPAR